MIERFPNLSSRPDKIYNLDTLNINDSKKLFIFCKITEKQKVFSHKYQSAKSVTQILMLEQGAAVRA